MSFKVVVMVLGLLGYSLAVPLTQPYNPQDFYPPTRIVGGVDAPDGCAPHMTALLVGDVMTSLMCGGSMIGQEKVLTAAHCIEAMRSWTGGLLPSARAVFGTNIWSDERRAAPISGYRIHPDYDRYITKNDIGVLYLAQKVDLDDRVKPIAMNFNWVGGGQKIYVTGWGTTTAWGHIPEQLQLLYVDSMSPAQCEHGVREAEASLGFSPPVHSEVEICTTHKKGAGNGMCHGDSGSALVDSKGLQVGIVSWGWPCALGHPDIHARISAFEEFLAGEIGNSE